MSPRFFSTLLFVMTLMVAILLPTAPVAAQQEDQEDKEVNVYSYRQPFLVQPLFDLFEKETDITVNVLFAGKGLVERIALEGKNSPADVILTTDIGRLQHAVSAGITQPVTSAILDRLIPADYRDPRRYWFGLTRRARVVFASRERVSDGTLTYESLADERWRGKICMRDGQHPYNIALFAAALAHHDEESVRQWLIGLKANQARRPAGNDRAQMKAVFAGECDIAIGNTYYLGLASTNDESPEQKKWAKAVRIIFPMFEEGGTHVNLSGMAMARYAPHREDALKLMTFLAGDAAQQLYAQINFEYPVRDDVPLSPLVASWGDFTPDDAPLYRIATLRRKASELVDEVRFNE